jgi:hypothetical protein
MAAKDEEPGRTEPCPPELLRRIHGFFASRPRGRVGARMKLVYSPAGTPTAGAEGSNMLSARTARPRTGRRARRATLAVPPSRAGGRTPQTLRYTDGVATLDVQVRRGVDGNAVLLVALEPPRPGLSIEVRVLPQEITRKAVLDRDGTAEVSLPANAEFATAILSGAGGEAFRIEPITVDL